MSMNLNIESWKEFEVWKIFRLEPTKWLISENLIEGHDVPYIAAKHDLNWLSMMCKSESFEDRISKWNCIVFVQLWAWSAWYVNYVESDFIWMQWKTCCWYIDGIMNPEIWVFLETVLCQERRKYSFWRSRTWERLKKTKIKLPADSFWNPDREFMENYIKAMHHKPITTKNKSWKYNLKKGDWKMFKVWDLFNVINGKGLTIEEIEENPWNIFCVQWWEWNNWSIGQIDIEYCKSKWYMIIDNNCLTVARVGTAWCVNFWSLPCVVWDKCKALLLKSHWTKYIYLFMQTILNQLQYKYSYGRWLVTEKYMDEIIKLPVDGSWNPDREFMENYIKNLPYWDRI